MSGPRRGQPLLQPAAGLWPLRHAAGSISQPCSNRVGEPPAAPALAAAPREAASRAGARPRAAHHRRPLHPAPLAAPAATVAGLSLLGTAGAPAAHAQDAPSVDEAVASIVDIVKATGEVVKQGVSAAQTGVDYAKTAYEAAAPVVKSAVEQAAPVVEKGVRTAVDVAAPALQVRPRGCAELGWQGMAGARPRPACPVQRSALVFSVPGARADGVSVPGWPARLALAGGCSRA